MQHKKYLVKNEEHHNKQRLRSWGNPYIFYAFFGIYF
jgi:hypothetical protein